MKKMIAMLLCLLMIGSFVGRGSKNESEKNQIPNPFVDCDTLNAAAKISGFDLTVPDSFDKYADRTIQAIKNDLIQVNYKNGDSELYIRKGTDSDDISGDYSRYDETNTVAIGELQVTFKGNDGKVKLATWTNGDYSYAVFTGTDDGGYAYAADAQDVLMSSKAMSKLIASVR